MAPGGGAGLLADALVDGNDELSGAHTGTAGPDVAGRPAIELTGPTRR
ncbi:MAG TPA: hypothetical protein VKZ81_34425 [Pseudonocardia sp.]|nr:hypothetical protein [Pseudonocardia sp.]HLU60586.1 hypothetical protein [Pseudonocardia sp.]